MYLAEVKAVAFAVISSGYRSQAWCSALSQTNAILGDTVYTIPRSTIYIRAGYEYTAGDETTLYEPPYTIRIS